MQIADHVAKLLSRLMAGVGADSGPCGEAVVTVNGGCRCR